MKTTIAPHQGFLHSHSDVAGIVDSVILLLHNPKLRQKMGSQGKQLITKKFNPSKLAQNWVNLLICVGCCHNKDV